MSSTPAPLSSGCQLAIATPSGHTDDRSVTLDGTLTDGAGAPLPGVTIEVDEAGTSLGTATVGADGRWSSAVLLEDLGANSLTARTVGGAPAVASAPVVLTLDAVLSPAHGAIGTGDPARSLVPAHGAEVSGDGGAFTFVFRAHPGHVVVDHFGLSGPGVDHLSLPHARFGDLADVLRHTSVSGSDAVIHLSARDTITLIGVSRAALRAHGDAVLFHG